MAAIIRFPLKMTDGAQVKTMEELREHFDFADVLRYYADGRLCKWLRAWYYDEEAEKVEQLDLRSEDFKKNLCDILGVTYQESTSNKLDLNDIIKRNERLEQLKQFTADDKILASVDSVAFTQEELISLLSMGVKKIYLCGEKFTIPEQIENITYVGVNKAKIEFDGRAVASGIDVSNVEYEIDNYICNINKNIDIDIDGYIEVEPFFHEMDIFYSLFANNSMLGIKLLRLEAEKGSVSAQISLGLCYIAGFGVEKNDEEGMKWIQKVAEQGWAKAQTLLGACYLDWNIKFNPGLDCEQRSNEAIKWYRKAAEQGYMEAQYQLAEVYRYNIENDEEAIKWYLKASEQGYVKAQFKLGDYYEKKALNAHWERNMEAEENYRREVVKWYRRAAEQGDAGAQFRLSNCYRYGYGVEKNDIEATRWYQKAAEQGDKLSQYKLDMLPDEDKTGGGLGKEIL